MASPWDWDRVCLLVALCLSIVSGQCPDNNLVKVAVNGIILEEAGQFATVSYPVGTSLQLLFLWPSSATCSDVRPPPPVVTVGGVPIILSEPKCVGVVNIHTGNSTDWHSLSTSHIVTNENILYHCNFDGCSGASLILTIASGSEIQHHRDGGYCLSSDEECHAVSHTTDPSTSSSTSAITSRTTSRTTAPTTAHTTPHTTAASAIPGLNPLIYTLLAVILLGTASIVAMVTCWMRHRRLMRRRREALFGREYLDFMGEQDFTTVTTNQLLASLAEAPPTYQQSEVIEQRMREGGEDTEETPPPLPPRNTTTERRQVAPEPPLNVTGAVEANSEEEGGDKEDGSVEPILSDHSEEEEESYSAKDDDSIALIH